MRICLLSKQFSTSGGGSERYAYELAKGLALRDHDVDIYTLRTDQSEQIPPLPTGINLIYVGRRRRSLVTFETLYYSLKARRTPDFNEYDIIHGTLMPASTISLALSPPKTPLVLTCHAVSICEVRSHNLEVPSDILRKFFFHPMNVLMDMAAVSRAFRVIAISKTDEQKLTQFYPASADNIVQISHGVDANRFSPDYPVHPAVDPNRFTLLYVGRLVSRKRIDLALHGLANLDREDVELLIAGSGTHEKRLKAVTEHLGIDNQVTFLGFVPEDELPSLYETSDAFLFLPRYEGFGLTFLEAMASGTPVIGRSAGGFPDLVTDGKEGLFVEGTPTSVAGAINRLADSPTEVFGMGKRARKLAEGRTWARVAEETEEVYRDVCKNT